MNIDDFIIYVKELNTTSNTKIVIKLYNDFDFEISEDYIKYDKENDRILLHFY